MLFSKYTRNNQKTRIRSQILLIENVREEKSVSSMKNIINKPTMKGSNNEADSVTLRGIADNISGYKTPK